MRTAVLSAPSQGAGDRACAVEWSSVRRGRTSENARTAAKLWLFFFRRYGTIKLRHKSICGSKGVFCFGKNTLSIFASKLSASDMERAAILYGIFLLTANSNWKLLLSSQSKTLQWNNQSINEGRTVRPSFYITVCFVVNCWQNSIRSNCPSLAACGVDLVKGQSVREVLSGLFP